MVFANGLWLAYHRPPRKGHHCPPHNGRLHPSHKGTVLMDGIVQFMNRVSLYQTNGLFINRFILDTLPTVTFMPCSSAGIG